MTQLVYTYALPNDAEAYNEPAASVARWAWYVSEWKRDPNAGWELLAKCKACGKNTGNWCDVCERMGRKDQMSSAGRVHGTIVGTALCTTCENHALRRCPVCEQ